MSKTRTDKVPIAFRSADVFDVRDVKTDAGQTTQEVTVSVSSEFPVERWLGGERGMEVLSHAPSAVRLDWFKSGKAPLLLDHWGEQIGALKGDSVEITDDKKVRLTARFSRSATAKQIADDMADDIRQNVSIGYRVFRYERARDLETIDKDSGRAVVPFWRATDWQPLEVSVVAIPADPTVGKNRSHTLEEHYVEFVEDEPDVTPSDIAGEREPETVTIQVRNTAMPEINNEEMERLRREATDNERQRQADVRLAGEKFKLKPEVTEKYLRSSMTSAEVYADIVNNWSPDVVQDAAPTRVDMTPGERKRYSLTRAINAVIAGNWNKAGFELECSRSVAERLKREPNSFFVPLDVQMEPIGRHNVPREIGQRIAREMLLRDLTAGTATDGAELVATNLLASSFIDLLRNAMAVRAAGATVLSGLVGNVAIPRQTAGSASAWASAEAGTIAETEAQFDQVTLAPRTLGTYTDLSRRLLLQSTPAADAIITADLATGLGIEMDRVATQGSGASGQPQGIELISGVNDVDLGVNGAALTWANVVDMETQVANDNALIGGLAYLFNAKTVGKLKSTSKSGTEALFVFDSANLAAPINGYPVFRTNQLRSNIAKGTGTNLSIGMFGNWPDLLIGEWGVMDILVDPFTGSTTGNVRIRVMMDTNVAVRHPESFCFTNEIVTT